MSNVDVQSATKATRVRRNRIHNPFSVRPKRPTDGSMSLVEHLQELRRRVIISVLALIVGTIVGFMWYQHPVNIHWFTLRSLGDILRGPYCSLPPENRAVLTLDGECRLIATSPFEMFMLRLKVGALAGSVFASPVWLHQLWAFITPGLMKNERRWTLCFVTAAVTLFVSGAVLAYFVIAIGLQFLLTMGGEFQVTALSGGQYFNFILTLLVMFGVSFEVPLIIAMLNLAGILSYESIKDKRRIIIVSVFIFAAFMTPGQDPYSMVALGASLCLLVELAIQFTRLNDKRRKNSRPDWMDVDDEHASTLTPASDSLDSSAPIASSDPITPSSPIAAPAPESPAAVTPSALERPQRLDTQSNFDDVL